MGSLLHKLTLAMLILFVGFVALGVGLALGQQEPPTGHLGR